MSSSAKGLIMCGVGGQGVVLASNIFTEVLMDSGYDVKKTEQHGMSQRNGPVNAQIKFGEKVYAPVVGKGNADVILAFEKAETLRWLEYLKPDGCAVINNLEIDSVDVQLGTLKYPENLSERIAAVVPDTVIVDAAEVAAGFGTVRAQSMLLLGIVIKHFGLEHLEWEKKIAESVPAKYQKANIEAFRYGLSLK